MKDKLTFSQKVKVLNKLFDAGYNTEKKLQQLDMTVILELQKQTKANKLFSYLGGGSDEQQTKTE